MTDWLQIIISGGIGGTIVGVILKFYFDRKLANFNFDLDKELSKYNLINESQFKAFNELWKSLIRLKRKGQDLWEQVSEKEMKSLVKYINDAHKSLEENSLVLNEEDYKDLKKILDQFWYYKIGKERLIDMPDDEIQQSILIASGALVFSNERQNQIMSNKVIKENYEKLLEQLRNKFQNRMGVK